MAFFLRHFGSMILLPLTVSILLLFPVPLYCENAPEVSARKIVVVYHCAYPPVSFFDQTAEKPSGFFIDIMQTIAARAGLRVSYICRNGWQEMIDAIVNGEADLGALMRSEEREKKLAFTSPFEVSYLSFFARSQSDVPPVRRPEAYTVGVVRGSMSFEQLKNRPGLKLHAKNGYEDGIFSLLAGEIGLFAGEESMILKRARETGLDDRIRRVGKPFVERERGLAVRKNDLQLVEVLNKTLQDFTGSPEYRAIYLKWYGTPTPYWTVKRVLIAGSVMVVLVMSSMGLWRYLSITRINKELIRNITQRKSAEKSLEKSRALNESILETVDEGFIVIDPAYKIVSANKAYLSQVRRPLECAIGHPCYEISHQIARPCYEAGEDCAVRRTFETGNPHTAVHRHHDNRGGMVIVEIKSYPIKDESGKVTSVIEVVNNITEKMNLEAQVCHSQKMEAVGHLAGGIAHDFNNILTAIIGYGSLAKTKMAEDSPARHDVEQILESADRAANLTRGLLAFSRKQMISPRPVSVNDIVKNIEKLILRLIGEDIVSKIVLSNKDMNILADSGQIEQILMNLATNARDAMPEGGSLTIHTEPFFLDDAFLRTHGYGKKGNYALLTVRDSGKGMDQRTKENIFEPFFTTKEVGRGTGLGLSIVYGIVKQHNGFIECDSEPGKGTSFSIYLPLVKGDSVKKDGDGHLQPAPGGSETVLVAEDDAAVRSLMKEMLTLHGYTVIEAADGQEAVVKYRDNRAAIHLVLLDVLMPGKSGKEVYDEIRRDRNDIKAIFMSGYTADVIHKKGILDEGLVFISKPVTPTELLKKIRETLDGDS